VGRILVKMDKKRKTEILALTASCLGVLYGSYSANVASVALPKIALTFGLSNILQNWVSLSFILTMAIFTVPLGRVCGKYGVKKTFLYFCLLFLAGTIGTALSTSATILFLFRILGGIGAAGLSVSTPLLITDVISPENRGKAFGINLACVYIGIAMAPFLGGVLTYDFGWQSIFWIMVPFIILNMIVLLLIPDEWYKGKEAHFDWKGSIIFALGIIMFIYGFSNIVTITGLIIAIIGIILLITFAKIELKIEEPIFKMGLFKNKRFLSSNLASLFSYIATFAVTTILAYYLQYIMGWNSAQTGLLLIISPILMALSSPLAGYLSDHVDPQKLTTLGMGLVTIGLFILIFLNKNTNVYILILSLIFQGLGYGIFASPNNTTIMSSVPEQDTPMASSALATMCTMGETLSMTIFTVIFAIFMGEVVINPSNFPQLIISTKITFIILVIASIIAAYASYIGVKSSDKLTTNT
jgi:MFS family permease